MAEISPILMRIHDSFDTYDRYPHTDHSVISNIAIRSSANAYAVTTYPGGYGTAFDAFNLAVNVPIFGSDEPSRVETGRDSGGLMRLEIYPEEVATNEAGAATLTGTLSEIPKIEGLVLPGDQGFELFPELHKKLQAIQPILEALLEPMCNVEIHPAMLSMRHKVGVSSFDLETRARTDHKSSIYEVTDLESGQVVRVELDATEHSERKGTANDDGRSPTQMKYTTGSVKTEGTLVGEQPLDDETLLGFTALQHDIASLYS